MRGSADLVAGGASRPIWSGMRRRDDADAAAAACRGFDSDDDEEEDGPDATSFELVDDSEDVLRAAAFSQDGVAELGADDVSSAAEQQDLGVALLVPGWGWPTGAMRSSAQVVDGAAAAGTLSTMLRLSMLVGRLASSFWLFMILDVV